MRFKEQRFKAAPKLQNVFFVHNFRIEYIENIFGQLRKFIQLSALAPDIFFMQLVSVLNEWLGYISRIIDYIKII